MLVTSVPELRPFENYNGSEPEKEVPRLGELHLYQNGRFIMADFWITDFHQFPLSFLNIESPEDRSNAEVSAFISAVFFSRANTFYFDRQRCI